MPQGSARQGAATTDWVAHMRARDQLTEMISARGGTPAPAAVVYQLPSPVNSPAQATALAATLEDRVAQAYLGLVALTGGELAQLRGAAAQSGGAAGRSMARVDGGVSWPAASQPAPLWTATRTQMFCGRQLGPRGLSG